MDTLGRSIANEGDRLARVREDDARRVDPSDVKNLGDFVEGSTIEACAERGEKPNHVWIWVTFDGFTT